MENNNLIKKQPLTVSKETQNFIECLIMLDNLYSNVSEAVSAFYGSGADDIMETDYFNKSHELQKVIEKFMIAAISNNLYRTDRNLTEI